MAKVYLSVSSNYQAESHIRRALALLRDLFGSLQLSNVYRNAPLNHQGAHYLNLVLSFSADWSVERLKSELVMIEDKLDRTRGTDSAQVVSIDLDVLRYEGNASAGQVKLITCPTILCRSFILSPLSEIAGREVDVSSGLSYAALWKKFDKAVHPLEQVTINW
ncbi:MAG: 2-amino-4-hydroxy-6-hydroxymethyldihydropteridine diphosphokinase [Oceanospirillaceae bacterium]|nr:2-amino-4-hydroxy-6-hydroxymethyldihydropteridine diphosphokinase [Oceanospirillaceae bacterium]